MMNAIRMVAIALVLALCVQYPGAAALSSRSTHHDMKASAAVPPRSLDKHKDNGARCKYSGICDHSPAHDCGRDGLGCIHKPQHRRGYIKEAMQSSWHAYRRYAWGEDQLSPLTNKGQLCPWVPYNAGMTLLDGADTLWLMGLKHEYREARDWIEQHLDFDRDFQADTFTLSMTFLGSLLALHDLTGDDMYLHKSLGLADRMLAAYATSPSGWPWRNINLRTGQPTGEATNVGEAASPTLEFAKLTQLTGDPKYKDAAYELWDLLDSAQEPAKWDGLVAIWWNVTTGEWLPGPNGTWSSSIGAMGDLAYEYMLKTWVLSGGRDEVPLRLYKSAMSGLRKHILVYTKQGYAWLPSVSRRATDGHVEQGTLMEHLACFSAGALALGHLHGVNTANSPDEVNDLQLGEHIAATCYEFYRQSPSGLNPHAVEHLSSKHATAAAGQAYYDQQPELLESLVYLYRLTGNETYRDWGWQIFRAADMWTRVKSGAYTGLVNPTTPPLQQADVMWDWWLAETLKYLWLLFSEPDVMPLDEWVFNTEAHAYRGLPWAS